MNIRTKKILTITGILGLFGILPESLHAAETLLSGANTAWILTSTALPTNMIHSETSKIWRQL